MRQVFKGGNYSFFNLAIVANSNNCRNFSIFYLINLIYAAETIQGRKLIKGGNYQLLGGFDLGNYSRVETIRGNTVYS